MKKEGKEKKYAKLKKKKQKINIIKKQLIS